MPTDKLVHEKCWQIFYKFTKTVLHDLKQNGTIFVFETFVDEGRKEIVDDNMTDSGACPESKFTKTLF